MNKKNVNLHDASLMLDHINQAIHQHQRILLLTSTPSLTRILKEAYPNHTIKQVTGANNNEFKEIVHKLKEQQVYVLIVGVEQLINPTKWNVFFPLLSPILDQIMIEHAHQIAITNHDHKGEYLALTQIHKATPHVLWSLYTHALSKSDIDQLSTMFRLNNMMQHKLNISMEFIQANHEKQLQIILNIAKNNNTLIVVHDYLFAEILGFLINQQVPCGVVSRKVEESTKVEQTNAWQKGELLTLVATSDTLLPYPYPRVSTIVWAQTPLNYAQANEWHRRFSAKQSVVVDDSQNDTFELATLHAFSKNEQLNDVIQVVKKHQGGITLREMEQHINIDSYAFEKVLKSLSASKAIKKEKAMYTINQPWNFDYHQAKACQTTLGEEHQQLIEALANQTRTSNMSIDPKTMHSYHCLPYPLRPKVLFPRGFYAKTLIPDPLKSEIGYVFAQAYTNVDQRARAIVNLLHKLGISLAKTSLIPLHAAKDGINPLINTLSSTHGISYTRVFAPFDSSIVKQNKNPYHKMSAIQNQIKLQRTTTLKPTTVVIANHADHTWQMAVVAYELLSKKMTDRVIVIFNQP